jgi:type II secretory pathway pseudopilin PulG
VTLSIITLIAAISIPVALKVLGTAESSQTRTLLNGLAAAADEYNIVTGETVPHFGRDPFGNVIDLNVGEPEPNNGDTDITAGYFIFVAGQVPTTSKLIGIAAKENVKAPDGDGVADVAEALSTGRISNTNFGDVRLLDTWGNQIRYAGGVSHNDAFTADDYLPAHPTAFFASAGPDGLFGEVQPRSNLTEGTVDDDNDGNPDSADNVYSFDQDGL